jgi:hypothetical protein
MLAAAQDVHGEERVRPLAEEMQVEFPILLDPASTLGAALGFGIVPSGFFVDADGRIRYRHLNDFDLADPRVRWNLEAFLAGRATVSPEGGAPMAAEALELFAQGVTLYSGGEIEDGIVLWRRALEHDPDNFVIRSQIWVAEHPGRFYPVVDRDWQELQLVQEGYDKPLP